VLDIASVEETVEKDLSDAQTKLLLFRCHFLIASCSKSLRPSSPIDFFPSSIYSV
jgi:hypothetical protein